MASTAPPRPMPPPLILASASPRRRELVAAMGLAVQVVPAHIDESRFDSGDPIRDALDAACAKARAVAERHPDHLVIGADTEVILDGAALGKPADRDQARDFLRRLSGRAHTVATGLIVTSGARPTAHTATLPVETTAIIETQVIFRPLSSAEMDAYLDTDEPYDKAGAYGIQGRAGGFVDHLEGDYFNVVGLPLAALADLLGPFMDTSALRLPDPPGRWQGPRR